MTKFTNLTDIFKNINQKFKNVPFLRMMQCYLFKHFFWPFTGALFFFVGFLLTFQMFRVVKMVIGKQVPWYLILEILGHISISFLPISIPLSALFTALYTSSKLSDDSEIVAMRSFGFSKYHLISPFFISGLILAMSSYSLGQNIIPRSKKIFRNTLIRISSEEMMKEMTPENFFTQIPNLILFAKEVEENGQVLKNVFIEVSQFQKVQKKMIKQYLYAKKGILRHDETTQQSRAESQDALLQVKPIRLQLLDGNLLRVEEIGKFKGGDDSNWESISILSSEKTDFEVYDFPLYSPKTIEGELNKENMRSGKELKKEIDDYRQKGQKPPFMLMVEYMSRINGALVVFVFIFAGFSIGIRSARHSHRNIGLISMFILIIYYGIYFFVLSLLKREITEAYWLLFLPMIFIFGLALNYFRKMDWAE